MTAAMGFTLASDYFLVLLHSHRSGVFVFCFVHIFYILRVSDNWEKSMAKIAATIFGGLLIFAVFIFVPVLPLPDPLIVFAIVYAALFIQNIIAHIQYHRRGGAKLLTNRRLMLAGIILFALCDIHVLLLNLPQYLPLPHSIAVWGGIWIWVFYAPSQFLLGISAVNWE